MRTVDIFRTHLGSFPLKTVSILTHLEIN